MRFALQASLDTCIGQTMWMLMKKVLQVQLWPARDRSF